MPSKPPDHVDTHKESLWRDYSYTSCVAHAHLQFRINPTPCLREDKHWGAGHVLLLALSALSTKYL